MSDYLRTTRECTFNELNPVLSDAIRAHTGKYELGALESAALMCCETTSTKVKKGFFGGKPEVILTGVLLTPEWLVWAVGKEKQSLGVLSAKLRDIQVQEYEKSEMYKLIQDSGLDISGLRTDAVDQGSSFIGLGPEPASQKFRSLLKEALAKA